MLPQVFLQLNEQGLNVSLYWKNPDPRKYVNVVPTSAISGEGIPDLLQLMVKLTQSMMSDRLTLLPVPQCTVGVLGCRGRRGGGLRQGYTGKDAKQQTAVAAYKRGY
jgi:translation initiation factor IF-2